MALNSMSDGIIIYSNTGNIMFTSTGEIIESKKSLRKHKINKNIVHESFHNMREFVTDDEFWDKFLSKCSKNIFPSKDFKYMNNVLYYRMKTKKHRDEIYINDNDLKESLQRLKIFLRDKGIAPVVELNCREIFSEKKINNYSNWKEIPKDLQSDVVKDFINDKIKKYNLNCYESKHLESLIRTAIAGDVFNNDNIIINENKIEEIKYLIWNEEKRYFKINIEKIPLKFSKSSKSKDENNFYTISSFSNDNQIIINKEVETIDLGSNWQKFLSKFYN
jgi:hypothetical protein